MNSKVSQLKNSLDVLAKFKKVGNDLNIINEIIDSFEMIKIRRVEQNVNNLCKISVKLIDCEGKVEFKEKSKFKYFWPNCRFETDTIGNYKLHKSIHLNERQFVCDFSECNKTFKQNSSLILHKRTHSGEKPFKCDINGCGQSCYRRTHLNDQKLIHTGEKPYKCQFNNCGKRFKQRGGGFI